MSNDDRKPTLTRDAGKRSYKESQTEKRKAANVKEQKAQEAANVAAILGFPLNYAGIDPTKYNPSKALRLLKRAEGRA